MWFATRSGIDRYNGKDYTFYPLVYEGAPTNPKGIVLSNDNGIYAFNDKQIYSYNTNTDNFEILPGVRIENKEVISSIQFATDSTLWVTTSQSLYRLEDNLTLRRKVYDGKCFSTFIENNGETIWLASEQGVKRFIFNGKEYVNNPEPILDFLDGMRINTILKDSLTDILWIGTFADGVHRINLKTGEHSNSKVAKLPVRTISIVGKEQVWVGVDGGGIFEFDRFDNRLIRRFSNKQPLELSIPSNAIYHIFNDGEWVWVSTYTNGVLTYNLGSIVKNTYSMIRHNNNSLPDNYINVVKVDRLNRIWIGTNRGVSRFDKRTKKWTHFLQNKKTENTVILAIEESKNGDIWVGGYACEIVRIDKNDKEHIINIAPSDSKNYIYSITEDSDGHIWFGGIINNTVCYNPENNTCKEYDITGVTKILYKSPDRMVISTSRGVYIVQKSTGKWQSIFDKKLTVQDIIFAPMDKNVLWIGVEGLGVLHYHLKDGLIRTYSTSDGLTSNQITALQFDKIGNLWIATEKGLNQLNRNLKDIDIFSTQDGLPSQAFTFRASDVIKNGDIIWGTMDGAFELNIDKAHQETVNKSNLRFEKFSLFNEALKPDPDKGVLKKSIDETSLIELQHNQHSFAFEFIDLENSKGTVNNYSYRLFGFDDTWSTISKNHEATYTNIPPGKYRFCIRSFDYASREHLSERCIYITIERPWWNKWYAWIMYFLSISWLIWVIAKAYTNHLDTKDSEQKINFFVNLAHDIRTPLTLVKAPLLEIKESEQLSLPSEKALNLAVNNIDKLLNMVSQLLDFQKVESDIVALKVESTELVSFLESNFENFTPLARRKQIDLSFNIAIAPLQNGFIDQNKLQLIIENLVSNAIKYTSQGGKIQIKCWIDNQKLAIEVADNGIGISPSAQKRLFNKFYRADNAINSKELGSGIGLMLTKKMVTIHKGSIAFTSTESVGTTFSVALPIEKQDYLDSEILIDREHSQEDSNIEAHNDGRLKLMIVEDNEELRSYLAYCLNSEYHIIECADGEQALASVSKDMPDFIISDVMMPNITGLELCQKLKSNIETCHIPIILLSSLAERENIIKGYNAGVDDYITKPFDPSVLKAKIATTINNRALYRRKYIDKSAFTDQSTIVNDMDKTFMSKVIEYIEANLINSDFSIDALALEMAMSRSVFFKKMKSLTNQSPQEFIRDIKMKRASTLLLENNYSISEIAYLTGYPNAKYFSTAFKKYYGSTPSEFASKV